jgi:uncharacterized protein (TIGR04540 family)
MEVDIIGGFYVMSAKEIASQIKEVIDDLWAKEISDDDAKNQIAQLLSIKENRLKVFRGKEKTAVFVRIMGTKRMKTFDELIEVIEA